MVHHLWGQEESIQSGYENEAIGSWQQIRVFAPTACSPSGHGHGGDTLMCAGVVCRSSFPHRSSSSAVQHNAGRRTLMMDSAISSPPAPTAQLITAKGGGDWINPEVHDSEFRGQGCRGQSDSVTRCFWLMVVESGWSTQAENCCCWPSSRSCNYVISTTTCCKMFHYYCSTILL